MADNDEYDEVDAVVRIPKGERLADSRKTEGWSRGFTPKSTAKGPGHVEIRIKDETDAPLDQEPEIVYVPEYVQTPRQELTPTQQAWNDFASRVMDDLYEALKPVVAHWFKTRVLPAMKAKHEELRQKRQDRKAAKSPRADASERPAHDEATTQEVATTWDEPTMTVTSEQFQDLFMTWLGREDAQQALWHAIAHAQVEDGDAATLEWQRSLADLSPEERSERVAEMLATNPTILEGFARLLAGGGPAVAEPGPSQRGETS